MKRVQLDIGINIDGLKVAMRGANNYGRDMLNKELSDNKRILDQIVSLRKKSSEQIARDSVKTTQTRINALDKEVAAHQKADRAIEQSAARASRAQNQRGRMILKAGGLGAQMMGQNTIGYGMRMASVAGIGTEMVGGMSAAALGGVGVAIGALAVSAKLVEAGFEALSSIVTSTAGAFIGAMTTLGGFKGLQGSIEASAHREDMMGAARMTVSPEERLSNGELQQRARGFGNGFSEEEGIKAFGQLGRFSASQKSVTQQEQDFISKSALVSRDAEGNVDLTKSAHMYALLRAQGNDAGQAQSIMRNSIAIGQHTSMGPEDLVSNPGITQLTTLLGGDKQANYSKVFGLEGAINKYTGNVGESSTQAFGVMQGLRKMHMAGHNVGVWKNDKMEDVNNSIGELSKMSDSSLKAQGFGNRKEGLEGLASLEASAKDAGVSVKEYLDSISGLTMTQKQLNTDSKEMMGTTQELKASFNEITNVISDSTQPILKILSEALSDFTKDLPKHKDEINEFVIGFGKSLANLAVIITQLGGLLGMAIDPLIKIVNTTNGATASVNTVHSLAYKAVDWIGDVTGLNSPDDIKARDKDDAALQHTFETVDRLTKDGAEPMIEIFSKLNVAAQNLSDRFDNTSGKVPSQPDTSGGFGIKNITNPLNGS